MSTISIDPDAVDAMAGELHALAAGLAEDGELCRSTALSLGTAIDPGPAADRARATGTAWAALLTALADQTAAIAATFVAAAAAYRAEDLALAGRLAGE